MDGGNSRRVAGPEDIQREMEKFFEHIGRWKRPLFYFEKAWRPLCDVSETGDEIIVVVDLAGIDPDNVEISVENNRMMIQGFRREPASAPKRIYHLMEISYGSFERTITLPSRFDAERASAVYADGFLEVRLPKLALPSSEGVDIDVTS